MLKKLRKELARIRLEKCGEIRSAAVPDVLGTYSQGRVFAGGLGFLSGQLGIRPGEKAVCGNIAEQTRQAFANIEAICKEIPRRANLSRVLKLTVYLTDLRHFDTVNAVMREKFAEPFPARSMVEVSALPKGALIEIDAIIDVGI